MSSADPWSGIAGWVALAASPIFSLMALLTATVGDGTAGFLCSQAQPSWAPTGMAPMYLLMAAFHLPPWFRLIAAR